MTDKELAAAIVSKVREQESLTEESKLLMKLANEKMTRADLLGKEVRESLAKLKYGTKGTVFKQYDNLYQLHYDNYEGRYKLVMMEVAEL